MVFWSFFGGGSVLSSSISCSRMSLDTMAERSPATETPRRDLLVDRTFEDQPHQAKSENISIPAPTLEESGRATSVGYARSSRKLPKLPYYFLWPLLAYSLSFFVVLSFCRRSRSGRTVQGVSVRRLSSSDYGVQQHLGELTAEDLEQLCLQVGEFIPDAHVSGGLRRSPLIVEEVLEAVEGEGKRNVFPGSPEQTYGAWTEGIGCGSGSWTLDLSSKQWNALQQRCGGGISWVGASPADVHSIQGQSSSTEAGAPEIVGHSLSQVAEERHSRSGQPGALESKVKGGYLDSVGAASSRVISLGESEFNRIDKGVGPFGDSAMPSTSREALQQAWSPLEGNIKEHPYVRLPKLLHPEPPEIYNAQQLVFKPLFRPLPTILRHMRDLMIQSSLNVFEAKRLEAIAKELASFVIKHVAIPICGAEPRSVVVVLGRLFLAFNALHMACQVLGDVVHWEKWVKQAGQYVPRKYDRRVRSNNCEGYVDFSRFIPQIINALHLYIEGGHPTVEDVVDIKRKLFCKKNSPHRFRSEVWNPWRTDDEKFRKRILQTGQGR